MIEWVVVALVSGFSIGSRARFRRRARHHEPRAMHLPLPGQHTCTFQWRDKHGGSSFAPCAPCEGDIERRQWVETQWGEDVLSVQTSHVTPAVPPPSPAYPEGPVRLPVPGPGMRVSR